MMDDLAMKLNFPLRKFVFIAENAETIYNRHLNHLTRNSEATQLVLDATYLQMNTFIRYSRITDFLFTRFKVDAPFETKIAGTLLYWLRSKSWVMKIINRVQV
jgi:hypothetical protein